MIRVVLDTNILISATFWGNQPLEILKRCMSGDVELLTSQEILDELRRVLSYSKFAELFEKRNKNLETIVRSYATSCKIIATDDVSIPDVVRDPKDRIILACAVAGKADYIVTGDADLLVLNPYETIKILRAAEFLAVLDEDE